MYLWQKREEVWKRKHKFNVRNLEEWNKLKNAVEQLAPKLAKIALILERALGLDSRGEEFLVNGLFQLIPVIF